MQRTINTVENVNDDGSITRTTTIELTLTAGEYQREKEIKQAELDRLSAEMAKMDTTLANQKLTLNQTSDVQANG